MNGNKKNVFVFVGLPGSGKDTCTKYLSEKYGATVFSFTTMLKDVVDRFYLEFNRDTLIKISEFIRGTFGEDVMAGTMAKDAEKSPAKIITIGNARRMADIKYLSKMDGFVLIEIFADIKTRYERVKKRGEKTSDASQTFEQFEADHQRSTELSIPEVASHAGEHLDNNGSLENLYSQVDALIKKYTEHEN